MKRPGTLRYRLAALALVLAAFASLEAALWLLPVRPPVSATDPYLGFTESRPLFIPSEAGGAREIAPSRRTFFRKASFPVPKPEGEFRVFCLGGSTVQGRPYGPATAFPAFLELLLDATRAVGDRDVRCVNCGGVSYASYRLAPILREVLAYEPDLIVLYTGHNEFLEDRTYRTIKEVPPWARRVATAAGSLCSVAWTRALIEDVATPSPRAVDDVLPGEVNALLDHPGGLADYQRDDAWHRDVTLHFGETLRRMIGTARAAGVPLVLVCPVEDWRDTPPFKAAYSDEASADVRARCRELRREAGALAGHDPFTALDRIEAASALEDRHAGLHYDRAKLLERLGRVDEAAAAYLRAKDEDLCPLRMTEPLHRALREVAQETGTPLVEARAAFRARSRGGILGRQHLVDHVHPTVESHLFLAELVAQELDEQGWIDLPEDWRRTAEEAGNHHIDALPPRYFERGMERLRGLKAWAAGRAELPPPDAVPED